MPSFFLGLLQRSHKGSREEESELMIMKVEWESWDDYFELQIWVKMGLGGELSKLFYPWRLLVAGAGEEGGIVFGQVKTNFESSGPGFVDSGLRFVMPNSLLGGEAHLFSGSGGEHRIFLRSLLASNLLYDDHLNGLSGLVEPVTIEENLRVAFVYVTRPTTDHRSLMMCNNYRKDNRAIAISLFGFQFGFFASGGDVGRIHGDDC
ncbi:hypothetical protein U1Q18_007917 [Sarracenia purpurea var. burkii]